jgi:predicted RNA methylase
MKKEYNNKSLSDSDVSFWEDADQLRSKLSIGGHFTPIYAIELISEFSKMLSGKRILDPACGTGRLLKSVQKSIGEDVETMGVEINSEVYSIAKNRCAGINIVNSDFFLLQPKKIGKFDLVVSTPPFGGKVDKNIKGMKIRSLEGAFLIGSLQYLAINGHLILLVPEGLLFRTTEMNVRELINEQYSLEAIISLPSGIFHPFTNMKTNVILIKNNKQRDSIFFAEYLENNSLKHILSNYISYSSNNNPAQGFWVPISNIKDVGNWSYRYFRGIQEIEIIKKRSKYPVFKMYDLFEIDNKGRKDTDALLIQRVGPGRDIILKSELPVSKKIDNYFQFYPLREEILLSYVKMYLNSDIGKRQLKYLAVGASVQYYLKKSFDPMVLEIPDLKTQATIVNAEQRLKNISTRLQALKQNILSNPLNFSMSNTFIEAIELADDKDISLENLLSPIAKSYRIATKASPSLNAQLDNYFKMFEMVSAFNAIVLLSDLPGDFVKDNMDKIWTKDIGKYEKISFGLWVSLYRRLVNLYREKFREDKEFKNILSFGKEFYDAILSKELLDAIDGIPEKRNRISAHGGVVPEVLANKEIAEISRLLTSVFEKILVYGSLKLIFPQSMKKKNGLYYIQVKKLMGTNDPYEDEVIESEIDLDTEVLHLFDPVTKSSLQLIPEFIKIIECNQCGHWSIYFYDKIEKDKARYVSYQNEIHDYTDKQQGILTLFKRY